MMRPWEAGVRKLVPYVPGEQPAGQGLIKLNTNENPYPPAPGVARALSCFQWGQLRKYPDPAASGLVSALAGYHGLGRDQVFAGVGSDDVLAMAFLAFFNTGRPVLFPDVTYSFYKVWAELFRIPYETPKLDAAFRILPEDYSRENGGVVFPNPNAPTGLFMPLDQVEKVVASNQDVVVVVDEAYIDFGGTSARSLVPKYENLLVVQTFSKSRSMAGMRIGYCLGSPALIRVLNDVKYSYNSYTLNTPSLVAGEEAIKDEAYFRQVLGKVVRTREAAKERLGQLGFSFPDSMANFLFATHDRLAARELCQAMREKQIYVRHFNQPRLEDYLRISIGTDGEMEALYSFLEEYVQAGAAPKGRKPAPFQ